MNTSIRWKILSLAACSVAVIACKRAETLAEQSTRPVPDALQEQLNPIHEEPPRNVPFTAPPPPKPFTIAIVPLRSVLPPAGTSEQPRLVPGDLRISSSAPFSSGELPPLATSAAPVSLELPVSPLPPATAPDPAQLTVWITSGPAPDSRARPPQWDRPQLATDPTAEVSRTLVLTSPGGLRESPPPFLRIAIPDPFEQISIAELRNPPPDDEQPVRSFAVPKIILTDTPPDGKK